MADLSTVFAGRIHSPNPFWLASGPPTNCGEQVMRAFDAGWGGAVWKTLGEPIVNVSSRYSSVDLNGQRMMGLNNIELITRPAARAEPARDRGGQEALSEARRDRVADGGIASAKRGTTSSSRSEDAGADGLELNFGCPHGMSERGMGSAVGQVPEYTTHDHRVGERSGAHAGAGEADAEHQRHPRHGARGADAAAPTGSPPSTPSTRSPASIWIR